MTQKNHVRTVEIRTCSATCDECGERSGTYAPATLMGHGWQLIGWSVKPVLRDLCPNCVEVERGLARWEAENKARAKHIAALESGEPIYVHGRVLTENGVEFR